MNSGSLSSMLILCLRIILVVGFLVVIYLYPSANPIPIFIFIISSAIPFFLPQKISFRRALFVYFFSLVNTLVWSSKQQFILFDEVTHFYTSFSFTLAFLIVFPNLTSSRIRIIYILLTSVLLGITWEIYEYSHHLFLDDLPEYSLIDTLSDLLLNLSGTLLAVFFHSQTTHA